MAHDIFISYSTRDKATADAVCHALESNGIRCWIAPRDVPAGRPWKASIVEAIRHARVVVLIFSGEANGSSQVQREVDIAFEAGHPIIPFRIEDVEMSDELYFCVAARHWLDALAEPREQEIANLVNAVAVLVSMPAGSVEAQPAVPRSVTERPSAPWRTEPRQPAAASGRSAPASPWRSTGAMIAGGVCVAVLIVWGMASLLEVAHIENQAREGIEAYEAGEYSTAVPLLEAAAEAGRADAQYYLGRMYMYGLGVRLDYSEAARLLRHSAQQGEAAGQNAYGALFANGWGVEQDRAEALRWYRLAAEQHYALAWVNLAASYEHGLGVEQDHREAVRLYRLAAEQGEAEGQFGLAWMLTQGSGVEADDAEAVQWYRRAADQEHVAAKTNLGYMYENGRGVSRDLAEAVRWYRRAAEAGSDVAQANLGFMYERGSGVTRDRAEALEWYRLAAEQGNDRARTSIERLRAAERSREAVAAVTYRFRASLVDEQTRVLILTNPAQRSIEFDLRCTRPGGESRTLPIRLPAGGSTEIGFMEGWSGNFIPGDRCEAHHDGDSIWYIAA